MLYCLVVFRLLIRALGVDVNVCFLSVVICSLLSVICEISDVKKPFSDEYFFFVMGQN